MKNEQHAQKHMKVKLSRPAEAPVRIAQSFNLECVCKIFLFLRFGRVVRWYGHFLRVFLNVHVVSIRDEFSSGFCTKKKEHFKDPIEALCSENQYQG